MKHVRTKHMGALIIAMLVSLSVVMFNPATVLAAKKARTAATQIAAYYQENPDIPDFGAFAGVKLGEKKEADFGAYKGIAYAYDRVSDVSKINEYKKVIIAAGYEFQSEKVSGKNNRISMYTKGTKGTMFAAGANGKVGVVLIDLEKTMRKYDKFPTVPDFEPFVAKILVSKKEEKKARGKELAIAYIYNCNDTEASSLMMDYGKIVEEFKEITETMEVMAA